MGTLKGSIALTTNLGIGAWGKIFDDPMVAAAMLDRLLHVIDEVGYQPLAGEAGAALFQYCGKLCKDTAYRRRHQVPAPLERTNA